MWKTTDWHQTTASSRLWKVGFIAGAVAIRKQLFTAWPYSPRR
ncbi:MAG: hypothetical protein V3T72_03040 [Thermoanaerobaculia bacterium]